MRSVFLSYAREDRKAAGDLARALESLGWSVWWDLRLSAGQEFDEEIDRRLREASAVVVLWSRASVGSRWVKAEADVGAERGVLIPALLEDVEAPLPYRRVHSADLTDWSGAANHEGVADIHSALKRLSGKTTPTGPKTTTTLGMNRRWSGLRPLKRWAIALLLSLAAVVAVWMVRQALSSEDTVIVPDVVGMRLDEARLQLSLLGIHGPGERDENGEPFPEGTPDLETITRVRRSLTSTRELHLERRPGPDPLSRILQWSLRAHGNASGRTRDRPGPLTGVVVPGPQDAPFSIVEVLRKSNLPPTP